MTTETGESAGKRSRREQIREATLVEICAAARQLLVEEGREAVSVNAIARKLGMSGPALYRYHASQADLVEALRKELFRELIGVMRRAGEDADTPARRLLAISRALRGWSIGHPAEFRWLFASPAPTASGDCDTQDGASSRAFGEVFLEQFVEIWNAQRFPIPNLEDKDPAIVEQVQAFSDRIGGRLPPEAAYVFVSCWMRLYGLLCMEALNQISFVFTDLDPVFEECLQDFSSVLDIPYEPPVLSGDALSSA